MSFLNLRAIVNALSPLVAAVGAVMLVPAGYSLLTDPDDTWIFWLPGAAALALGATLFYFTRARRSGYISTQI